ncbi:unnamed protein product [Paramecium sonneborni]|uniref:Uncharacterized protein n=1 Tax=Paramecium sonneborni TaxID=65129 RepID=A0A8S1RRK4_9CILI|nr:unnamed protein product [Paramecium sonneborni]
MKNQEKYSIHQKIFLDRQYNTNEKNKKIGQWSASYGQKIKKKCKRILRIEWKKIGKWTELYESFLIGNYKLAKIFKMDNKRKKLVMYYIIQQNQQSGEILLVRLYYENFKLIAGGCYNNQGNKNDLWIDLSRNFWEYIKSNKLEIYLIFQIFIIDSLKQNEHNLNQHSHKKLKVIDDISFEEFALDEIIPQSSADIDIKH